MALSLAVAIGHAPFVSADLVSSETAVIANTVNFCILQPLAGCFCLDNHII